MRVNAAWKKAAGMFGRIRYRNKILLIILLFTLGPLAVLGPFYLSRAWSGKVDEVIGGSKDKLDAAAGSIHDLLNDNIQKTLYVISNRRLTDVLSIRRKESIQEAFTDYQIINEIFDAVQSVYATNGIMVYSFNDAVYEGKYIQRIENLDTAIKDEVMAAGYGNTVWKYRLVGNRSGSFSEYCICLYRRIQSGDETLAIAEIRIPFKLVAAQLKYDIPDNSFIVYDAGGGNRITVNPGNADPEAVKRVTDGYYHDGSHAGYYVVSDTLKANANTITLFIPRSDVTKTLVGYAAQVLAVFVGMIAVMIFLAEVVSRMLTKRLTNLLQEMDADVDALVNRNAGTALTSREGDEFGKIGLRFAQLIEKVREYFRRTAQYEVERKTYEVDLLQACINPHFLYNTLSAIKWAYKDPGLADVIDSMVGYYRTILNRGDKFLAVSREVEMLRQYVSIQKFAYKAGYSCSFDIDESVPGLRILKNLLQPIVENAILHGVNGLPEPGAIRVSAGRKGGALVFAVEDNGAGMPPETVKRVLEGGEPGLYGGYGIRNVQRRIQTYYGEGSGIFIESAEGRGTVVTVTLPLEKCL